MIDGHSNDFCRFFFTGPNVVTIIHYLRATLLLLMFDPIRFHHWMKNITVVSYVPVFFKKKWNTNSLTNNSTNSSRIKKKETLFPSNFADEFINNSKLTRYSKIYKKREGSYKICSYILKMLATRNRKFFSHLIIQPWS